MRRARPAATATRSFRPWRLRPIVVVPALAIAGAIAIAILTAGDDRWSPVPLAVIAVFTVLSASTYVDASATGVKISGSFLGVMLAAVLFGGGPAALLGVLAETAICVRHRGRAVVFAAGAVSGLWYPIVGGIFFHAAITRTGTTGHALAYYLLVFATFVCALAVNFSIVSADRWLRGRVAPLVMVRDVLIPVLPAELFSALLTMGAVYIAVTLGTVGIVLVALVLAIFQYLVGELLKSKRRGEDLHRLATIDTLTGLVNRDRFHEQLNHRIANTGDGALAVMLIDLDRFKEINDALGHHYGDEVLRQLGPRLRNVAGDDGVVARLGGDEFAVLVPVAGGDTSTLDAVAAELISAIQEPVFVDELALDVGASVGIARYPVDGEDANTLLRCADVAMYAAKDAHAGWKFYASELDRNSVRKLSVLSDFRRALDREELLVYYQPIVDVAGAGVRGAEALVRWDHPKLGLLAPGAFVQTVEQTSLIGPMTRLVLERAIVQCAGWRAAGQDLSVAVNLSVRNLLDRNLPAEIARMLSLYGLPPSALQLEITESVLMSDPERVLATVTRLNALGVRLSVDDFGTGYSSLVNLRQMPIDELKIDRSFVSPMLQDESDLIIVRSTINLGHDLGMRVIAEGVEDEETLVRLAGLGCDLAQGYHLSRPMPAEQFGRWLDADAQPDFILAV